MDRPGDADRPRQYEHALQFRLRPRLAARRQGGRSPSARAHAEHGERNDPEAYGDGSGLRFHPRRPPLRGDGRARKETPRNHGGAGGPRGPGARPVVGLKRAS